MTFLVSCITLWFLYEVQSHIFFSRNFESGSEIFPGRVLDGKPIDFIALGPLWCKNGTIHTGMVTGMAYSGGMGYRGIIPPSMTPQSKWYILYFMFIHSLGEYKKSNPSIFLYSILKVKLYMGIQPIYWIWPPS